jgi:hypothetical protein
MSNRQISELTTVQVANEGVCTICGMRATSTQCNSCPAEHYLCIGCADSHLTALQGEQEPRAGLMAGDK